MSVPTEPTLSRKTKDLGMESEKHSQHEIMRSRSSLRGASRALVSFILVALLYYVYVYPMGSVASRSSPPTENYEHIPEVSLHKLVPLEAHIISKCPDTLDCLKLMVLPTMQRVMDKVNFTLSYIGTPTDNDGVDCKHGPEECMGNIVELCAAKLYPSPKTYLGFTMCLTRDYHSIPQKSLVEDCALEHGIDFSKLNACTVEDNGGTGMGMLRDSVRRTREAGVTKSCTVRLNEEIYCIRDGGKWIDCPSGPGVNDLVIAIEKLYKSPSVAPLEERKSPSKAR